MRFDLFSSGRLHRALEEAEYPDLPAVRTLSYWIQHDSAPVGARQAVARLLGFAPDTEKQPPLPYWAERLVRLTISEMLSDPTMDDLVESAWQRLEARRLPPPPDHAEDQASGDPPGAGGASVPLADP